MHFINFKNLTFIFLSCIIIGILILLTPFWSVKIILLIVGILLFSKIFHKAKVAFLIIFFIVLMPILLTSFGIDKLGLYFSKSGNFPNTTIYPNTSIETVENISINSSGELRLQLVSGNKIEFHDTLNVTQKSDNELLIEGGTMSKSYLIKIGTENLGNLLINAQQVHITGKGTLNTIQISSIGIEIDSDITCKTFDFDGTGIDIEGTILGDILKINGTGVNINATFGVKTIYINGTGISINVSILDKNRLTEIKGTSLNSNIDYPSSTNKKSLIINATSGLVKIQNHNNVEIKVNGPKLILEWIGVIRHVKKC